MNKLFKITVVAAVTLTTTGVFAAPRYHYPRNHRNENKGIRLATDIVNLVHSSVNLLTGTPTVVVQQQAPTVIVNNPPPRRPAVITRPAYRPKPQPVTHHYGKPRVKNVKHDFTAKPRRR